MKGRTGIRCRVMPLDFLSKARILDVYDLAVAGLQRPFAKKMQQPRSGARSQPLALGAGEMQEMNQPRRGKEVFAHRLAKSLRYPWA
jgi:hypothetical protein